jgi:hypothetical protein
VEHYVFSRLFFEGIDLILLHIDRPRFNARKNYNKNENFMKYILGALINGAIMFLCIPLIDLTSKYPAGRAMRYAFYRTFGVEVEGRQGWIIAFVCFFITLVFVLFRQFKLAIGALFGVAVFFLIAGFYMLCCMDRF